MKRNGQKLITILIFMFIVSIIGFNIYSKYYKFAIVEIDAGNVYYEEQNGKVYFFYDEEYYDFNGFARFDSLQLKGRIPVGTRIGSIVSGGFKSKDYNKGEITPNIDMESQRMGLLNSNSITKNPLINKDDMERKISKLFEDNNGTNTDLLSKTAGFFYDSLDGYEEIFDLNKLNSFELLDFNLPTQDKENVKVLRNSFKIVNNNIFYAIIQLKDSKSSPEKGEMVSIKVNTDSTITGEILDVKKSETDLLIKVVFNSGYDLIENTRILESSIILDKKMSYQLPSSSVFEIDGIQTVMKVNHSGYVESVPVEVIKIDGSKTFVSAGNDGQIVINDKSVTTLRAYDEVIIHPNSVKIGDAVR